VASNGTDPWGAEHPCSRAHPQNVDDPLLRLFAPVAACAALLNVCFQLGRRPLRSGAKCYAGTSRRGASRQRERHRPRFASSAAAGADFRATPVSTSSV